MDVEKIIGADAAISEISDTLCEASVEWIAEMYEYVMGKRADAIENNQIVIFDAARNGN